VSNPERIKIKKIYFNMFFLSWKEGVERNGVAKEVGDFFETLLSLDLIIAFCHMKQIFIFLLDASTGLSFLSILFLWV